mgnify:CR=1 FL=1
MAQLGIVFDKKFKTSRTFSLDGNYNRFFRASMPPALWLVRASVLNLTFIVTSKAHLGLDRVGDWVPSPALQTILEMSLEFTRANDALTRAVEVDKFAKRQLDVRLRRLTNPL